MKDEEKSGKKSSKKWIIVIAVIIVIAAIALGYYKGIFSMPTGLAVTTGATKSEQTNPQTPSAPAPATLNVTGTEIISKEVVEALPYYEPVNLDSGRYSLELTADKPVWVRLYDKLHFEQWEKDGTQGNVVTGTNCCRPEEKVESLNTVFTVSIDHGGEHYLLILGNETTSIKFRIVQIYKA